MRRLIVLTVLLVLALPLAASAQTSPFGPLPPAATPEPTPPPEPKEFDDGQTSRPVLFIIGGIVLLAFIGIGTYITRDARRNLTEADRRAIEQGERPRTPEERKTVAKQKAKARAAGKRQRQARKKQRR